MTRRRTSAATVCRALAAVFAAAVLLGPAAAADVPATTAAAAPPPGAAPRQPPPSRPLAPLLTAESTSIIEITGVDPPVAAPGVAVTVTGTLHARAGQALNGATLRAVLSRRALVSRDDVQAWVGDVPDLTGTSELSRVAVPGTVAPGARVPFSLVLPADRLRLERPYGATAIALEVSDANPANRQVLRTFVGWSARKEYEPLQLTWVVPLTLEADRDLFAVDANTRSDAWRRQVGPGNRVDRIISGTDAAPVTWAVDPALLGSGARSAAQVAADPVTPLVTRLVDRLTEASTRHTVWALPYADPDVAASSAANPQDATVRGLVARASAVGDTLKVPARTDVSWPVDGSLEGDREDRLRQVYGGSGPAALLVSASSLPAEAGVSTTADRKGTKGIPLLAWDDRLSALMLDTRTVPSTTLVTQQFIAETAAIVAERPGRSRTFAVVAPRGLDPDAAALARFFAAVGATPWITSTGTGEALSRSAAARPAASGGKGGWSPAGAAQLTGPRLADLGEQRTTIGRVATILGDGAGFRQQWQEALDQLTSARWRTDPDGWAALQAEAAAAATRATRGIVVSPQTTNFLADEGVLQITVVNDLDDPVENLQLNLAPTNARMRIDRQPDPVRIAAHSKATVQARAVAVAAGLVPINAWLTTSDGTRVGQGATITVRANPPGGWLYVISGAVVALVFLGGIIRTLRRSADRHPSRRSARRTEGARGAASGGPAAAD